MGRSSSSLHCNDDDLLVQTLASLAMGTPSLSSSIASLSLLYILFIELACSTDNGAFVEVPVCNDDDLLVRTLARLAMGSSSLSSSIASVLLLFLLFTELTCSTNNGALVEVPVPNNKRLAQLSGNHRPVKISC